VQFAEAKKIIDVEFEGKIILYQNSLNENSIKQWLSVCEGFKSSALRASLDIDYNIYGAGEAELAWLDEEIQIVTTDNTAFNAGYLLMKNIYNKIIANNHSIGHLKFLMQGGDEKYKISFSSIPVDPFVESTFPGANRATVLINARVQVSPSLLEKMVVDAITETELASKTGLIKKNRAAFKPGFPKPTHRVPA
jgi:hypothetical protein